MAGKLTMKAAKPLLTFNDLAPAGGGETVSMLAPEGRFVQVPLSDAGTLAAAGFRADTPELRAELAERERFGGLGSEIASAGLGLASGLTLGFSKPLLHKAGVPVDELERQNPDAFLAGEMGSFLVPVAGGIKALGAAGKVAKGLGAAQSGVSAVGELAKKIVAKKIQSELGQSAVKMGAEGLVYGGARASSEILDDFLEDKELKAETILAHAGSTMGAGLIGAGLGVAFPLLGKFARKVAESTSETAKKFFDPNRSRQLFTGAMQKELRDDTGKRFQQAVEELGEGGLYKGGVVELDAANARLVQTTKGALPTTEAMLERQQDIVRKVGRAMGEKLAAADAAAQSAGIAPEASKWGFPEAKVLSEKVNGWLKVAQITEAEADRMHATVNQIAKAANATGGSLEAMHKLRRGLDARIGPKNWDALKSEEIELVKDMRRMLSEKIDQSVTELDAAGLIADGGAWKRLNRLYANLKEIEMPLSRSIGRANANVNVGGLRFRDMLAGMGGSAVGGAIGGPVGAALGTLTGVANKAMQTDRGLLLRAELGEWLNKRAASGAKAWTTATEKMLEPATKVAERESLLGAKALADEWFMPLQSQLAAVAADPLTAADAMHADTNVLREHDPELADALVDKQMRIYAYLYEHMPKPVSGANVLGRPWKPTPAALQSFAKVVRTAQNPQTIFDDVASGTASREQVKALQALYPATYQKLVDTVMRSLVARTEPMPYEAQLRLSRLLGAPISRYMQPKFVARMQSLPQSRPEPGENSGMGRVTLAGNNLMSETERVEARNLR